MSRILVVYGTTDGHTAKIASAVADTLRAVGCDVLVADTREVDIAPEPYDGIIVAASVHIGGFQRAARRWVRAHVGTLNAKPTAFLTVCLGILEANPTTQLELEVIVKRFLDRTMWRPTRRHYVAGATPYTRYGIVKRWMIRRIVAKSGGDTDTSHDVEYTDWNDLREFTRAFFRLVINAPAEHGTTVTAG